MLHLPAYMHLPYFIILWLVQHSLSHFCAIKASLTILHLHWCLHQKGVSQYFPQLTCCHDTILAFRRTSTPRRSRKPSYLSYRTCFEGVAGAFRVVSVGVSAITQIPLPKEGAITMLQLSRFSELPAWRDCERARNNTDKRPRILSRKFCVDCRTCQRV